MSILSNWFKGIIKDAITEMFQDETVTNTVTNPTPPPPKLLPSSSTHVTETIPAIIKPPTPPDVKVVTVSNSEKVTETSIVPSTALNSGSRFIKVGDNLWFCRNIKWTTWLNKPDWKGHNTLTLGSGSQYPTVTPDMIPNLRGISLPFKINKSLVCTIFNKTKGYGVSYHQIDVGPGYVDDNYWRTGTNPKTETGVDHLGNKSALAGIDLTPCVVVDMGWGTYEDAYNKDLSGICDILIYDPDPTSVSKVAGHDIPTSDSRAWVSELPPTGSPFFSWNELLRGWNRNERPPQSSIDNLLNLTKELLHPIREKYGRMRIGSALRDPETNEKVGGVANSLHLVGRAADLVPLDMDMKALYEAVQKDFPNVIRECVLEDYNKNNAHLHLAGPIHSGEHVNIHVKD